MGESTVNGDMPHSAIVDVSILRPNIWELWLTLLAHHRLSSRQGHILDIQEEPIWCQTHRDREQRLRQPSQASLPISRDPSILRKAIRCQGR